MAKVIRVGQKWFMNISFQEFNFMRCFSKNLNHYVSIVVIIYMLIL